MKAIGGGSIWERLPTPGFLLAEPKCGLGSVGHPCGGVLPEAMTHPVQLYCWHFMAYPHLPADFDKRYATGWVTVPNSEQPRATADMLVEFMRAGGVA